jgi:ATP-dependent DNA helicase RecG
VVQGLCVCAGAMLNHGLDEPLITIADNEVVVVLRGPGEDMNRIRIPENITAGLSPTVAATLNERQKTVLAEIDKNGTVSTGWITKTLGIVKDTAAMDIKELVVYMA